MAKNHLDIDFKQNNFFSFCIIMSSLATVGAIAEIFYKFYDRVKYIKHSDGTIEITGDEEKISNLINKNK